MLPDTLGVRVIMLPDTLGVRVIMLPDTLIPWVCVS